ncbi:MAG: hypothetical protein QGI24_09450, partial [Kiritimatiellia bacterium]|nr:hypothetical protein [Kiritimatiellia bacterium]
MCISMTELNEVPAVASKCAGIARPAEARRAPGPFLGWGPAIFFLRCKLRCLSISVLFALLVLSAPVAHARGDGPSLVALRSVYDEQKRMFDKPLEEKRAEASERYLADLQSLVRYMEQKGDDFGVRPVNKEIVRFKAEKTVPEESAAGTPEL